MLNKDYFKKLIHNEDALKLFLKSSSSKDIERFLKYFGKPSVDFNFNILLPLLKHQNQQVRYNAIKILARSKNTDYVPIFIDIFNADESSDVQRECVSAIARLKNNDNVAFLLSALSHKNPEIVLQAIRGLLYFKNDENVYRELSLLAHHPNEIVQSVISKDLKKPDKSYTSKLNHTESPSFLQNTAVNGDTLKIMKLLPDESIHLTFTSPPYYNARDYSIYNSYKDYLNFMEKSIKEIHRITKEGRFFIINTSPIIIPRVGRNYASTRYPIPYDLHNIIVNNGWEFIDDIFWVKPEASVKNRNGGFYQHRKPLSYKPNSITECIMVYRKKTDKLIDWNIKQYSTDIIEKSKVLEDFDSNNVWHIDPSFDKVHSAVFPIELSDKIIKYYSFIGDLVFDPFGGSGTVAKSSIKLDRKFFTTELSDVYFNRMRENLSAFDSLTTYYSYEDFTLKVNN